MSALDELPVCVIGDSFVAGVGDSSALGWTGRITAAAHADGLPVHLSGLGIPGDTSVQIAARWDEVTRRLRARPDSVVVAGFGCNDVIEVDGRPRVPAEGTRRALRSMVDRTPKGRLLVVGPPPIASDEANTRIAQRSRTIGAECRLLAVPYIATFEALLAEPVWMDQVAERDGAHPDADGYGCLARVVTTPLTAWLRRHAAGPGGVGSDSARTP